MKKSLRTLTVLGLLLVAAAGVWPAAAQDGLLPDADPVYGELTLAAGFLPDPFILSAFSGGPINVDNLGLAGECTGNVNDAPDLRILWSGQTAVLRIFYLSTGDTTLVIRTPGGKYACNDDYEDLNPLVIFNNPEAGSYDIWIGSYDPNAFEPGYLFLTESASSPQNIISPLIGAASGGTVEPPHDHPPVSTPEVTETGLIPGVEHFPNLSFQHVEGRVTYAQVPPVGGEHHPVWLNCGIYDQPVRSENAVHSLEHGAVWITYDPSLPSSEVEALRNLTRGGSHRLLSPYPGLPSPIVASAWGYQLQLQSANDPRLVRFINEYEQGPTTPERGATCAGGIGSPLP